MVLIVSGTGRMLPAFPQCVYFSAHITAVVQLTVTSSFFNFSVGLLVYNNVYFKGLLHTFRDAC